MTRKVAAILVAAGQGQRAGWSENGPKQYQIIGGEPVIWHTLNVFLGSPLVDRILVVRHPDDAARLEHAAGEFYGRFTDVVGGADRQASVLAGLEALAKDAPDVVLIHDAVRPFVTNDIIAAVLDATQPDCGALPVLPVVDTLKRLGEDNRVEATVSRDALATAQTPQGFDYHSILKAHRHAANAQSTGFTDDASIAEWAGHRVVAVGGSHENVKLTLPSDLARADRKLRGKSMIDVRVGNGYDVHQLVDGDSVWLCGVCIPHDQKLSGHSDADVGLHALTDALLATCGAGDIGTHFPPSDMQWKGASSDIFLRHAAGIVADKGGRISNVDVTLICEAPKVGPHRDAMRSVMAAILAIDIERVSVKATTNETIGFIGRREGIAAIATASVVFGD